MKSANSLRLSIIFLSTYPPRQCGIATFTSNLVQSVSMAPGRPRLNIIAVTDRAGSYRYGEYVVMEIERDNRRGYERAADSINNSPYDIVCVQHEFGIFGGEDGDYLLDFLGRVRKPVVTTLHTILAEPDMHKVELMRAVARKSALLVAMLRKGIDILEEGYGIPRRKSVFIPHGIPAIRARSRQEIRRSLALGERPTIATFGLINPGKGIEYMIMAMPQIVNYIPDALYLVLGKTHPEVKKRYGESYRESLVKLAHDLGVGNNVRFVDEYLTERELVEYLLACDVYVTPYVSREQITSGTLAYAIGLGKAIVSTRYYYAEEMLAGGRGLLVDFRNPGELAEAVVTILTSNDLRMRLERSTSLLGSNMSWPKVGQIYAKLFADVAARSGRVTRVGEQTLTLGQKSSVR
ncbi:MAG TPA: glycosyltransferase [Firmicutes bacterium]|nr:glycosyltransferase [Bacillota bacterium]